MRRRSGWPSKTMPYRSNASRSNQPTPGQHSISEATIGNSSSAPRYARAGASCARSTAGAPPRRSASGGRGRWFLGQLARAVAPGQVVDATEVDTGFKAQAGFGAQLGADGEPLFRRHFERQLAQRLGQRDIRAEGGLQIGLQGFEPGHHLVRLGEPLRCFAGWRLGLPPCAKAQRAIVLVRRILFCICSKPYTSASAVGGQPGT